MPKPSSRREIPARLGVGLSPEDAAPGTVLSADGTGIVVKARSGALRIHRLQRAGGKELDAGPFLNGWDVAAGDQVVAPNSRRSAS